MLNPKEQYQTAYRLVQAGEVLQAEHCLRTLMDAYPDHPDVMHLLGVVLKDSGQLEESVALLCAAVDKCPENGHFHYHYGLSVCLRTPCKIGSNFQSNRNIFPY